MVINFVNFTQFKIPKDFFEKIAKEILKKDVSLEVVLLGQRRMRKINKKFAGKNRVTTCLSFPEREIEKSTKKELKFILPKEAEKSLGEILLCPARIKKISKREKKDFEEKLKEVFLHSLSNLQLKGRKNQ